MRSRVAVSKTMVRAPFWSTKLKTGANASIVVLSFLAEPHSGRYDYCRASDKIVARKDNEVKQCKVRLPC